MRSKKTRPTVLVVDDERGPRDSLRMLLAPSCEVITASTGAEALEILRTSRVDVTTLDLNMPGIDGQTLMRAMRDECPQVEIIVITGCATLTSAQEGIRQGICDYLQKPFDVVQVTAAVRRAVSRGDARVGLVAFLKELGDLVGHERDAQRILEEIQRSQKIRGKLGSLLDAHGQLAPEAIERDAESTVQFLEVLAETIEVNDSGMRGHARRVAFYAGMLADRMNLSLAEQEHVRLSAFLHDLGKVGVPSELLVRPTALDAHERALMQRHPAIGARLLEPLDLPASVSLAVRHHHEWWDGTGYPDELAGEEIPLVSRIVAVADAFDAMSTDRPYRPALARHIVVDELKRFAGVQFDPLLAKEFLAILETSVEDMDLTLLADAASGPAS
jgi:cyclic di-GMP phosphodiesterase